jgi:hypothetical protein
MNVRSLGLAVFAAAGLAAAACGPAPIRPVSFPDPEVSCPAGRVSWRLDILDRRANPEESDKLIESLRSGLESSFPGCRWTNAPAGSGEALPAITIIVHRLGVEEHNRYQDAAAEWTVTATTESGSTLTEFDANEEETRPAYSGADEEALNEAFRKALQRTVRGLAQMERLGSARPPEGTIRAGASIGETPGRLAVSR